MADIDFWETMENGSIVRTVRDRAGQITSTHIPPGHPRMRRVIEQVNEGLARILPFNQEAANDRKAEHADAVIETQARYDIIDALLEDDQQRMDDIRGIISGVRQRQQARATAREDSQVPQS